MSEKAKNVGIFLYDECDVLDFTGPFAVFNLVNEVAGRKVFNVFTLATHDRITTKNGLRVLTDETFAYSPDIDILVIPGGKGYPKEMYNERLMYWLRATKFKHIVTLAAGSFILANSGLLNGKKATTQALLFDEFAKVFPKVELMKDLKFVDNEAMICSGGNSTGIDAAFYLVNKILDAELAQKTAELMEYGIPYSIF